MILIIVIQILYNYLYHRIGKDNDVFKSFEKNMFNIIVSFLINSGWSKVVCDYGLFCDIDKNP